MIRRSAEVRWTLYIRWQFLNLVTFYHCLGRDNKKKCRAKMNIIIYKVAVSQLNYILPLSGKGNKKNCRAKINIIICQFLNLITLYHCLGDWE
jgi:hypothetical protein